MKFLLFIFTLTTFSGFSQYIRSSKAYVKTCYQKKQCFALSDEGGGFVFYNQENNEFIVTIDFKMFKVGNDSLDAWLDDLDDTKFIFRGQLNSENLLQLSYHNSKTITLNGIASFNKQKHSQSLELSLFEINSQGVLFNDNKQDYYDRVRSIIQFAFSPKDFKINLLAHHLKKTISISIHRGYINRLTPTNQHFTVELE